MNEDVETFSHVFLLKMKPGKVYVHNNVSNLSIAPKHGHLCKLYINKFNM